MNEPDPKPPLLDDSLKGFCRRLLAKNEWLINKIVQGLLLLAAGYIGVKVANIESKTDATKNTTELVKDVATEAARKADVAADVGKTNLVLNAAQRADYTGKDEAKVIADAKSAAEQLPTTGPTTQTK